MLQSRRPLLGVDLRPSCIRLAEIRKLGSGYEVVKSVEVAMPHGVYQSGQIVDPTGAGLVLKEALKGDFKVSVRQAAVALGGQNILVRRLLLPRLKPRRLRDLLESQGDNWIPFLREGAIFDLHVVNPAVGERELEALLVAVPTRTVEAIRVCLRRAGLRLKAIDLDAAAQQSAVVALGQATQQGTSALLDIAPDRIRLALFSGGVLAAVRTLDVRAFTSDPGVQDQADTGFLVEVRRTLELMLTQTREPGLLERLVLTGETSVAQGVQAQLRERLIDELGAERLAPEFSITAVAPGAAVPSAMLLAYGAAQHRFGTPVGRDLMPRPSMREKRQQKISSAVMALVFAGTIAYGWNLHDQEPALQAQQLKHQSTLSNLQAELAREPQVAALEALDKRLAPIHKQLNRNDPWSDVLPDLKQLLPEGLKLANVTVEPPKLILTGEATSPDRVMKLLQALADSPRFGQPILIFGGVEPKEVTFSISAEMSPREVAR